MIDKRFLKYMDEALKEWKEYEKAEHKIKLSFEEFLLLVVVWKMEAILESIERKE